jgi:hypothetical protein
MGSEWRRLGGLLLCLAAAACGGDDDEAPAAVPEMRPLAVAVDQRAVRLSWPRALMADAQSYVVERREDLTGPFARVASVSAGAAGDTLVYLDTAVEPETLYGYRLRGVNALGDLSEPTVVAGVRTPSRPGLRVEVTQAGSAEGRDLDGFVVRAVGPDTVTGVVQDVQTFRPIAAGDYTVTLTGVAPQCTAADTVRAVAVSDVGVETLRTVAFAVTCRNPSRGDVVALVELAQGEDTTGFRVTLTGRPTGAASADSVVFLTRTLGPTGGAAAFTELRPGQYEVELDVPARCTLEGTRQRAVTVASLSADTVRYALTCGGGGGGGGGGVDGDVQPLDPARPYKVRYRWAPAQATVGSTVTLIATMDLTGGPPITFGGLQVTSTFDPTKLRATSFSAGGQFTSASNLVTGGVAWVVNVTSPLTTPVEVARITFTVTGGDGTTAVTRSVVASLSDLAGNEVPYTEQTQVVLEAPLRIGSGGGGGTNQPPTAVIAGPATLAAVVGTPVTFGSTGSADPDGTIAAYAWTLAGATPSSATTPSATVTYAAAGTYVVRLQVTDDRGASATAEKTVTVTAGGNGSNLPPVAVIAGPATLAATTGAPLSLAATGSSDADGSIVSYAWSLPGSATPSASGATVQATWATAGTYTATLTVTDDDGATASASKPVVVTAAPPPPSDLVLRTAFGAADPQGLVPLSVALDLSADLPSTPGVERIREFRLDSLTWNGQLLEFVEARFPSNVSGTFAFNPSFPGRVFLAGRFVGDGPTGNVALVAVVLRPRAGATGTTTTRTWPGLLQSTAALGSVDYVPFTRVVEGSWPVAGGVRAGLPMGTVSLWPVGAAVSQ